MKIMSGYGTEAFQEAISRAYEYDREHFDIKRTAANYIACYQDITQ